MLLQHHHRNVTGKNLVPEQHRLRQSKILNLLDMPTLGNSKWQEVKNLLSTDLKTLNIITYNYRC